MRWQTDDVDGLPAEHPNAQARIGMSDADLAALRSQVVRDVKQAYYRWIAAQQAVTVLDATLDATRENLKANASLYRNGKVTRDLVYRFATASTISNLAVALGGGDTTREAVVDGLVDSDEYLRAVISYVHANPLAAGMVAGPALGERLRQLRAERLDQERT